MLWYLIWKVLLVYSYGIFGSFAFLFFRAFLHCACISVWKLFSLHNGMKKWLSFYIDTKKGKSSIDTYLLNLKEKHADIFASKDSNQSFSKTILSACKHRIYSKYHETSIPKWAIGDQMTGDRERVANSFSRSDRDRRSPFVQKIRVRSQNQRSGSQKRNLFGDRSLLLKIWSKLWSWIELKIENLIL